MGRPGSVACTHVLELVILHHVMFLPDPATAPETLVGRRVVLLEEIAGTHVLLFVTPLLHVLMLDVSFLLLLLVLVAGSQQMFLVMLEVRSLTLFSKLL